MKKAKIGLFLFSILIIAVIWYSIYAKNDVYEWIGSFGPYLKESQFGMAVFILLAALSAMLSPFSSAPLIPIALVIWGPVLTAIMLLAGWTIGGMLAYFIGWKFGYAIAIKFVAREKIDKWSMVIKNKFSIFLLFVFRLMTPSETGYVFGVFRYPFWKYLLITFLSELPYAFGLSFAGEAIISREHEILVALGIASIFMIAIFYRIYNKEFRKGMG